MAPLTRRRLIGLAGSTVLAGCASPALVTRDDKRDPFEGGIGGTGIVGVLTDFGSVQVNGLRIEIGDMTRVVTALGPVGAEALAAGQVLTIMATRSRDRLVARHVRIEFPLVGVLAQSDGGLSVNSVPVRIEPGAVRAGALGARVAVSGLWTTDAVVASRIDPAPFPVDMVSGDVARGGSAALRVGSVPVEPQGGQTFPNSGAYVVATGQFDAARLRVERVATGRFVTGAQNLRQLAVEGYLRRVAAAPGFRIAGLGHSFDEALRVSDLAARRAIYVGPYDGLFLARAGYTVPESVTERRRLLGEGYDGPLGDRAVPTR
ncbi:MAG: hypothetical protein AAF865_04165 [Pseudomonadota bacterium]